MNAIEAARLLRDAAGLIGSYGEYYTTGSTNPVSVHEEHINLLRRLAENIESMSRAIEEYPALTTGMDYFLDELLRQEADDE
jgi:hypothetical protein